jgi:general transcription factor 3C polypeptide 3 (transcription factor C subunit 4)
MEWVGRRVQFEEINMLAELYMEVDEYEVAIDFIKKQTRKLQGRWAESGMWDATDNDDEYADTSETAERWLPLELRVKLGLCRLWTDDLDFARVGDLETTTRTT